MALEIFTKQPGELRDFDVTFGPFLDAHTDTALAGNPIVVGTVPSGITLVTAAWVPETRTMKFWVSGGTSGKKYTLTASLLTTGGRRLEADIKIAVKEIV